MSYYPSQRSSLPAGLDPIAVLQSTPSYLSELVEALGSDDLELPNDLSKRSPRDLLAYLADVELVAAWRLRQTVAAPGVQLSSFEPDVWGQRYARLDAALAVESFRAVRAWNLAFLASLTLQDWLAEAYHPERGFESVDQMVRALAAHDLNQLAQLGIEVAPPL